MKRLLFMIMSVLALHTAAAQDSPKFSTFEVGFVPPLSTNGREAAAYTNMFSLNILAGISHDEMCFSLNGITGIVRRNVSGFHISGVYNFVGNEGRGVLVGGIGNNVLGHFTGVELAGVFNTSREMSGVQLSGVVNWSGFTRGVQFAGVANKASDMEGVQGAGVANVAGTFRGIQLAGVSNVASDMDGLQLSGVVNVARNMRGIQLGGVANVARNVSGIQASGILNKAADVRGVQIGLINIARDNDCPVGLVNIIRRGEMAVGVTFNELSDLTVTFRSGGKVMYGIVGVGIDTEDNRRFVLEGGIGARINCAKWFRINNELKTVSFTDFSTNSAWTTSYALLPTFRIAGRVELFAGPTLNFINGNSDFTNAMIPNNLLWNETVGGRTSALYVGYTVGLQFVFRTGR